MIGVIANTSDRPIVHEFFELFKTPWEFHRAGRHYNVVLCCGELEPNAIAADVLLVYAGDKTQFDSDQKIQIQSREKQPTFAYEGSGLPIYDYGVTFQGKEFISYVEQTKRPAVRVGYDLFREVGILLTSGQPSTNAAVPTVDLHIALLRDLITGSGIPLMEIPPVPDGYPFITCLTHDVDHASLRRHKLDHTMFGFLYRATLGSVTRAVRGRMSGRQVWTNTVAAAKVPLVYMGIAGDPWMEFDRYTEIETGKPSTFFFLPFERRPGCSPNGKSDEAPQSRGSRYDVSHVKEKLPALKAAGCEIGLHGIDAWADSSKGRNEAKRISEFSGTPEMGVRMHWLYWNEKSPAALEAAGFSYDSTMGFNDAVGYRAGTSQAFKPLSANRILELPLHTMDTALFTTGHMNLSSKEAWDLLTPLWDHAESRGGTFTVNWHDRSIAPERLWGEFYIEMLDRLQARRPWFSTAMKAVTWFRKRRAAVFESTKIISPEGDELPNLRLRMHRPRKSRSFPQEYTDTGFQGCIEVTT